MSSGRYTAAAWEGCSTICWPKASCLGRFRPGGTQSPCDAVAYRVEGTLTGLGTIMFMAGFFVDWRGCRANDTPMNVL